MFFFTKITHFDLNFETEKQAEFGVAQFAS